MGLCNIVKRIFGRNTASETNVFSDPHRSNYLLESSFEIIKYFNQIEAGLIRFKEWDTATSVAGGYIEGYIDARGLDEYTDEIYAGVTKQIMNLPPCNSENFLGQMLGCAANYINQWESYNDLLKQGWGSESYRAQYRNSQQMFDNNLA
jgi:hypothetical protein